MAWVVRIRAPAGTTWIGWVSSGYGDVVLVEILAMATKWPTAEAVAAWLLQERIRGWCLEAEEVP